MRGEDGSLNLLLPNFDYRAYQAEMTEFIEGATGTGKSLQDLLSVHGLLLATKAKDKLPTVSRLKGRVNQLCLLSLDEQTRAPCIADSRHLADVLTSGHQG